jgi:CHAP domain
MKNFKLTSPHMHGPHVEAFQRAMKKHGWYHGEIDGDCGQLTVQGFYRSKYWLGYSKPDKSAGDLLYSLLTGTKKPSPAMAQRAVSRKKAQQSRIKIPTKAFEIAMRHVGEKERTGKNDIRYSDWWGVHGPWCAMFASWCYIQAGSKIFHRGQDRGYAYVPYIVNDARAGINHLTVTFQPVEGDLVCFDWEKNGIADHVGLFERWVDRAKGIFASVEGNTSGDDSGNQSNGGMVAHRRQHPRYVTNVQAFVHVGG